MSKDVEKLGKAGSVVRVKDGFARNFLFPRGLAVMKTEPAMKRLKQQELSRAREEQRLEQMALQTKAKLEALTALTIAVLTHENDVLYGSITPQDIAKALSEEGIEIDKDKIELAEPIKTVGIYEVPVRLHPQISSKVKVWVVKK